MSHIYHFKDVHSHDTKPDTVCHLRSLEREPNCFRDGQATVTQILAMRMIIEEAKQNNLTAVLCFIDFKKTFDSIYRSVMMRIFKDYGVPPSLLQTIGKVVTPGIFLSAAVESTLLFVM